MNADERVFLKMEPREDSISFEITEPIQRAAVKLLAVVVAEIHRIWPEATDADRRRVAMNVMLAYWAQQQADDERSP